MNKTELAQMVADSLTGERSRLAEAVSPTRLDRRQALVAQRDAVARRLAQLDADIARLGDVEPSDIDRMRDRIARLVVVQACVGSLPPTHNVSPGDPLWRVLFPD